MPIGAALPVSPHPTKTLHPAVDLGVGEQRMEWKMKLISQNGRVAIWEVTEAYGSDFYVYDGDRLVRACPSIGMAREVAAGL